MVLIRYIPTKDGVRPVKRSARIALLEQIADDTAEGAANASTRTLGRSTGRTNLALSTRSKTNSSKQSNEPPRKTQRVTYKPPDKYSPFAHMRRDYESTQTNFRFMDLPREIRDQIYGWSVIQRQTETAPARRSDHDKLEHMSTICGYGHGPIAEAAITRVSKQVRAESLPIFYGLRRFPLVSDIFPTGGRGRGPRDRRAEPIIESKVVRMVDEAQIPLMRSFGVELAIPHHWDSAGSSRCVLQIDLSAVRKHDMWLSTCWNDDRWMPLDRYWLGVMTREGSGVRPLMERLRLCLKGVKKVTTRQDLIDLVTAVLADDQDIGSV